MMRDWTTTLVEMIGAALVVTGVWLWSAPAALVVGGLFLIGVSYLVSSE